MRYLLISLLVLTRGFNLFAALLPPPVNAADLTLTWEIVQQSGYLTRQQTVIALTLTNNGKADLPATGWKMYFNSDGSYVNSAANGAAMIERVNGDLFRLTPSASFAGVKAGATERIEITDNRYVSNPADALEGPYIVWNEQPDKGYAFGHFTIKPYKPVIENSNPAGWMTPQMLYRQNEIVHDIPVDKLPKIFPIPASYTEKPGSFLLDTKASIVNANLFGNESAMLKQQVEALLGKKLTGGGKTKICFFHSANIPPEGYRLIVKPDSINIYASASAGAFYAVQSLKSLIPPASWTKPQATIAIPDVEVNDEPRFGWRALMLDVARDFQSKEQVFHLLDVMALYKMNVFHFHLVDDEGWRLEIPELPELTAVGSKRGHTLDSKNFLPPAHGSGPDFSNTYGTGYYSKADFIAILKYAAARHINVIPEIETPGHARAAIKSMDNRYFRLLAAEQQAEADKYRLHDLDDHSQYSSAQDWNDNVIDVAMPSVYNFIETVVSSIVNTYKEAGVPLKTIHFGGDEVPAHVWELSAAFAALRTIHPEIKGTTDLWYYYYGRVNQIVKSHGLYLSGWEEMALRRTMLDGRPIYVPNPQFANDGMQAEVWNNGLGSTNEDLAYRLANAGYKVVLSNATNLYFDMAYYRSFDEKGLYWENFIDLPHTFSFIPFDYLKNMRDERGRASTRMQQNLDVRLTDYGKSNITGLQGALWSETINEPGRLDYMVLPRMLSLAQSAWSKEADWTVERDTVRESELFNEAWSQFVNILGKRELPRLDYYNGGYGYRIPKPGVATVDGKYTVNMQIPGFTLHYTTNGTEPTLQSPVYTQPVNAGGNFKVRAFDRRGRGGNTAEL